MRDVSRQFFLFFHPSILSDFILFHSRFISVLFFGMEKLNGNKFVMKKKAKNGAKKNAMDKIERRKSRKMLRGRCIVCYVKCEQLLLGEGETVDIAYSIGVDEIFR